MAFLITGLLLWTLVHLLPTLGISIKRRLIASFGMKVYIRSFMLLVVSAIGLVVLGWRNTTPEHWYFLPPIFQVLAVLLIVMAFILFVAATHPTRIKRFIRHPQLTGVVLWATAHLMLNGDSRSVLFFGWLGTWAILEIILISKREGNWIKPLPPEPKLEVKVMVKGFIGATVIALLHPFFTGMNALAYVQAMFGAAF